MSPKIHPDERLHSSNPIEEHDLLRTLITHSEDFIYFKDRESRFLLANMATAKVMGAVNPQELLGKTDFDFYSPKLAAQYFADEQKIVQTGLPIINYEEPGMDASGRIRYFFTTKVPLKNKEGHVIGLLGVGKDITSRKEAEEILKRDNETLEQLAQKRADEIISMRLELEESKRLSGIGTLAAMVAHELRHPLATIKLAIFNVRKKIKSPVLDDCATLVDKKIFESDQIINNLLFYSRIKPPQLENASINKVIKECVEVLLNRDGKTITLNNQFDSMADIFLDIDPVQMGEVFHNVLNNAYDALSNTNGVIEITGIKQGNYFKISIKDNGVGISKKDLQKVFDAFYTTKAKGTGLGLSVCYQIINLHRGSIKLESNAGEGTRVVINLPLKR